MKRISTADLRCLEVINLCGGERLGYPCDFEFDLDDGRVLSLVVNNCGSMSLFSKKDEIVIPWCHVECIGEDAILVRIKQNELSGCSCKGSKKRGFFR